jgi:hypothetical protein
LPGFLVKQRLSALFITQGKVREYSDRTKKSRQKKNLIPQWPGVISKTRGRDISGFVIGVSITMLL